MDDLGQKQVSMLAAEFQRTGFFAKTRARIAARHVGTLTVQTVRRWASGRPGPNVVTGNYLDSISYEVTETGDEILLSVGSNAPQSRRLELGFFGSDSLGRTYSQPPFPHFGPAADEMEQVFEDELVHVLGTLEL